METIIDENGNVNCLYCINCTNCVNCVGCVNCNSCEHCTNCKDCNNCTNSIDLIDCDECEHCVNCKSCDKCVKCEGAIFQNVLHGYKDYEQLDKDHIQFPTKGRCQYSEKIESFFLIKGLIPYKREPKNTSYKMKSLMDIALDGNYHCDIEELESKFASQGVQIAWNIGRLYKKYWITTGEYRVSYTFSDLALFLIMNKLVISRRDLQEFSGILNVDLDLRMFHHRFNTIFEAQDFIRYM